MKLSDIKPNKNNPRIIKNDAFKKLCKSIEEFPKMLELRPIILDSNNMILGGNMRFKALKELGYKEIPDAYIKFADTLTEEEKRRFIIEDNISFGDWDVEILNAEWNKFDLDNWGYTFSDIEIVTNDDLLSKTEDRGNMASDGIKFQIAGFTKYFKSTDEEFAILIEISNKLLNSDDKTIKKFIKSIKNVQ